MATLIRRPGAKRGFPIPTGARRHFALVPMPARLVEMEDLHFHDGSAVTLPDFRIVDPDLHAGRPTGLAVLAEVLRCAAARPHAKLLVVGHTDLVGTEAANQALSQERADAVHALLTGDRDAWVRLVHARHVTEDVQVILRWVAQTWAWPCDPGSLSGERDADTEAAVRRFQRYAGHELARDVAVDGDVGPQTWGAVFDVYRRALASLRRVTVSALDDAGAQLSFLDEASVGCGESFPLEATGRDAFRSVRNHRVELYLFDEGEEPLLRCHPSSTTCLKDLCELHNARAYRIEHLGVPPLELDPLALRLSLTDVAGLYEPGYVDPMDAAHDALASQEPYAMLRARAAGYRPGYTSQDDRGRIYVNHVPRLDTGVDWQDVRTKDTQYVELTVQLAVSDDSPLPPGLRVRWEWRDPDDPSNGGMRDDAAQQIDPEDPWLHLPDDNFGERDWPSKGAGSGAAFEEMPGFGLIEGPEERRCHTAVVDGQSKVRLHVTNVSGDNFAVHVELMDHPLASGASLGDATGVMTVWKRIDLEYREMIDPDDASKRAQPLPVDRIAAMFETAFIQLDVHPHPPIRPNGTFLVKKSKQLTAGAKALLGRRSVFANRHKPGWFCLVSALRSHEPVGAKKTVYEGAARMTEYDPGGYGRAAIEVDARITETPGVAVFHEDGRSTYFSVAECHVDRPTRGKTSFVLEANDVVPEFPFPVGRKTGQIGALYTKYILRYPRHAYQLPDGTRLDDESYGFGEDVDVELVTTALETGGVSPASKPGDRGRFVGQTVVFGHHPKYRKGAVADVLRDVAAHELGHGFGTPHKCGYFDHQAPAEGSCVMNYATTWLYRPGTREIHRFTPATKRGHFCARHLNALRRVHLEDNPDLWWW